MVLSWRPTDRIVLLTSVVVGALAEDDIVERAALGSVHGGADAVMTSFKAASTRVDGALIVAERSA